MAEDSGLGRESTYKVLRHGAEPGFVTISTTMGALAVRVLSKLLKTNANSYAAAAGS